MKRIFPLFLLAFLATLNINVLAGNWTTYTNSDAVRQVVSGQGRIWGATSGGIISYDLSNGALGRLTNIDGLKGIDFNCAEGDTAGNLWFGSSNGWLARLSPSGDIKNFAFRDSVGLVGRPVVLYDLLNDGDRLWVASDLGVSKFMPYSHGGEIRDTARKLGNLPDQEDVVCLALIDNNLWAGTAHGIAFIDKDNQNIQYFGYWRSFATGDHGLGNSDIRSIVSFNDTIFAGTQNGVYEFLTSPDTVWQPIGLNDNHTIRSLFVYSGNLLAAAGDGLYQYDPSGWQVFVSTGLPSGLVNNFISDPSLSLWAATPNSGLAKFADTQWTLYSVPGPAENFIRDVAIDSTGAVWMTHNSPYSNFGMSRLYGDEWTIFNTSNSDPDGPGPLEGLASGDQYNMTVSSDGNVWVGSWGGGLYMYDHTSWHHWTDGNSPMWGVPEGHYYWAAPSVTQDQYGNIWVPSLGADADPVRGPLLMGVFNRDATWHLFFQRDGGVPDNGIVNILATGNSIWIGRQSGLDRLDFGGTPFDSSDDTWHVGMSAEQINDLAVDPTGTVWFASPNGVFFIPSDADTAALISVPLEMSGAANTVASDGVGDIWVGTAGGLGMLRPDKADPASSTWPEIYTSANSPLVSDKVNDIAISPKTGQIFITTENGLSVFNSGILPPKSDLSGMEAYPDPVVISNGNDIVNFQRAPAEGTLSIYTASGELVDRFDLSQQRSWNLKNSKQEQVAAGIYIFVVKSGKTSGTGKFAVIR